MKSTFAAIGAVLGMLTVLLLGSTGVANANDNPDFTCVNELGVQICDNDVNVPVDIDVVINNPWRPLTAPELAELEFVLQAVTDIDVTKCDIKAAVVNLYNGVFDIPTLSGDVAIIGDISYGC